MEAVVLREFGGPENLRLESLPDPEPGPGDVLLRVEACGVCYHDVIARRGRLGGAPPMILGHEVVGEVIGVGAGVTGFTIGDRAATLQRMSCGDCTFCDEQRSSLCKNDRRFFGEEIPGGYATLMTAPARGLCPVPDAVGGIDAAAVCCTTGTAVHVCRTRGRIKRGETVLITGASGGVGLQMIQLCRLAGARTIALTTSWNKLGALEAAGADEVVVAADLDFAPAVRRITRGAGVDAALEIVGSATFPQTLKCVAPGGRVVVVGNLDTRSFELNPGLVIVKELEIVGAYATTPDEMAIAFDLVARGEVRSSVKEIWPLRDAGRVHSRMENREVAGRVILVPDAA